MTLDLSEVKKIAEEVWGENIGVGDGITAPVAVSEGWCDIKLTRQTIAFAQAIYAMGAAEQKEKDAKICESIISRWVDIEAKNEMAEAIRSQE